MISEPPGCPEDFRQLQFLSAGILRASGPGQAEPVTGTVAGAPGGRVDEEAAGIVRVAMDDVQGRRRRDVARDMELADAAVPVSDPIVGIHELVVLEVAAQEGPEVA